MDELKLKSLLISGERTMKEVMHKLDETAEKILFVVDENDKLLGTVTDGDIRRGLINGSRFDESIERIMHRDFTSITLDQPDLKENIKKLMIENKFEQIPVLDHTGIIRDVVLWTDILGDKNIPKKYERKTNQVVVMAGGKGARLDPFTKILPKPLIPIGDKTVIELIMEQFYKYGFYKFIYTLNYKKEYLKLYFKENKFPYSIEWVEEPDFLGTAGSLTLLQDKLNDTFFVINCDSLLDSDYEKILRWHKEHDAVMTIVGCHNEIKIPFGVLELSNGSLNRISEKPIHDVIINTGIYIMEPHALSYIPKGRTVDMNEIIEIISKTEKVSVYPISAGWFDIGQWEEYKKNLGKLGTLEDV